MRSELDFSSPQAFPRRKVCEETCPLVLSSGAMQSRFETLPRSVLAWLVPAFFSTLMSCGPKEEAMAPEEPAPAEPAPVDTDEVETEPETLPESEPEATPEPKPEPEPVALEPLCQSKCSRLQTSCTASAVETCRAMCDQWTRTPEPCVSTARAALECARAAHDLGCAPVVPESCGKHFVQVTECRSDPDGFEPQAIETKSASLPSGWEQLRDEQAGFSMVLPTGAALDTAGGRVWRGTGDDGTAYTVRVLPPLAKKPDARAWIKLAADTLAPCELETRLHGLIDKPDFLAMRYDSKCKGGGERHGSLVVLPRAFVVTAIEGPLGGDAETFLFGIEPL